MASETSPIDPSPFPPGIVDPAPFEWLPERIAHSFAEPGGSFNAPRIVGLANGGVLIAAIETGDEIADKPGKDVIARVVLPDGRTQLIPEPGPLNWALLSGDAKAFDIAPMPDGGFLLVYVNQNPTEQSIRLQRFTVEGTEITARARDAVYATRDDDVTLRAPSISLDLQTLQAVVTYETFSGGESDLQGKTYQFSPGAGGVPVAGTDFAAALNDAGHDSWGEVAHLANGTFVTAYQGVVSGVDDTPRIEFKLIWTDPPVGGRTEFLEIGTDPQVATLAGGGFVVAWRSPEDGSDIRYQVFDNGGNAVTETRYAAAGPDVQNQPDLVALPDGSFAIAWRNVTERTLEGRTFRPTGDADQPIVVSELFTIHEGRVRAPELGVTGDGRLLVSWIQGGDEVKYAIWDSRLSADPDTTEIAVDDFLDRGLSNFVDTHVVASLHPIITAVQGSSGDDTLVGARGRDSLFGGAGDDLLMASREDASYPPDDSDDSPLGVTFYGGPGEDTLIGWKGRDKFRLNDGEEIDHIDGRGATDALSLSALTGADDAVFIDMPNNQWTGRGGTRDLLSIESVGGTQGDDTIIGSVANDARSIRFVGNGGDDLIQVVPPEENWSQRKVWVRGGPGDDTIEVSYSAAAQRLVSIRGEEGDDLVVILHDGRLENRIIGEAGNDTLDLSARGEAGFGVVLDGPAETMTGRFLDSTWTAETHGFETVLGTQADDEIVLDEGANLIAGNDGDDTLSAGAGADSVDGGRGHDSLLGGAGDDRLWGRVGDDLIRGNEGADSINASTGADTAFGGAGRDLINGARGRDSLFGGDGTDTLFGGAGDDYLRGNAKDDSIEGGAGNDTVFGDRGRDLVRLGDGNDVFNDDPQNDRFGADTVYGGAGHDRINGAGGADALYGQGGRDSLSGGTGGDELFGGRGNDTLLGGDGADTLDGGGGADNLTGGAGPDMFVFAPGYGSDLIVDFTDDVDTLLLNAGLWPGALTVEDVIDEFAEVRGGRVVLDFGADNLTLDGITDPLSLVDDILIV